MEREVPIKGLRVLVDHRGELRKLARLGWTKRDASFYIIPYATRSRRGWVGTTELAFGDSTTVDFTTGVEGAKPKVSVHESGLTHATVDGHVTPDVAGQPLHDDAGGHVATIITFNPEGLPPIAVARGAPRADLVVTSERGTGDWWDGVRVALFVYTQPERATEKKAYITFRRPGSVPPLYVSLGVFGEQHPADNREPGVVVLAGWSPGDRGVGDPTPLVYAVTK